MEGRIVQKLECRPNADMIYMNLKKESIRRAAEPERKVQSLDRVVQNFKPVSDHKHNIEYREKKKAEGKKARDDKAAVQDMLFNAFEKHQYYNIKDLQRITNQPIAYLKEVLKEVCDYNMKNPHKNMWELKKEYRHYKTEEKKEPAKSSTSATLSDSEWSELLLSILTAVRQPPHSLSIQCHHWFLQLLLYKYDLSINIFPPEKNVINENAF